MTSAHSRGRTVAVILSDTDGRTFTLKLSTAGRDTQIAAAGGAVGLYQMLAYCGGFGLRDGTLVYAHDPGEDEQTHHLVGGTTVRVRTVDVEAEPDKLLRQVDALATALIVGATDA